LGQTRTLKIKIYLKKFLD